MAEGQRKRFCPSFGERGQAPQSPAKFPSIKKCQRATAAQDVAQDAAPGPTTTTTTKTFAFQPDLPGNDLECPSNREMALKLSPENLDLKRQISAQLTTLQSSRAARMGDFTAQMTNMAQKMAQPALLFLALYPRPLLPKEQLDPFQCLPPLLLRGRQCKHLPNLRG